MVMLDRGKGRSGLAATEGRRSDGSRAVCNLAAPETTTDTPGIDGNRTGESSLTQLPICDAGAGNELRSVGPPLLRVWERLVPRSEVTVRLEAEAEASEGILRDSPRFRLPARFAPAEPAVAAAAAEPAVVMSPNRIGANCRCALLRPPLLLPPSVMLTRLRRRKAAAATAQLRSTRRAAPAQSFPDRPRLSRVREPPMSREISIAGVAACTVR
jgi:hypothetical protein